MTATKKGVSRKAYCCGGNDQETITLNKHKQPTPRLGRERSSYS